MSEEWRDIKGYEGFYQISNFGQVKRLESFVKNKQSIRTVSEKIIKPQTNEKGYLRVGLNLKNKRRMCRIHRLVAEAFIDNVENKPEVNHIDGDKTNNQVSNLEWCTRQENINHAEENKLIKHGFTKVTDEIISFIRDNSKKNNGKYSHKQLAEKFNISVSTVSDIFNKVGRYSG